MCYYAIQWRERVSMFCCDTYSHENPSCNLISLLNFRFVCIEGEELWKGRRGITIITFPCCWLFSNYPLPRPLSAFTSPMSLFWKIAWAGATQREVFKMEKIMMMMMMAFMPLSCNMTMTKIAIVLFIYSWLLGASLFLTTPPPPPKPPLLPRVSSPPHLL